VETLVAAVAALRDPDAATGVDPAEALAASLACIHDGAVRMREGMEGLDAHAASVRGIIETTSRTIDCDAECGEELRRAADHLSLLAAPCSDPDEKSAAILLPMIDQLARCYTMAREREVHRAFSIAAPPDGSAPPAGTISEDDADDGLF